MAIKLHTLLHTHPQHLEPTDVFSAFQRSALDRWGTQSPFEPVRWMRGVLVVRCSSPLWRSELLYNAENIKKVLAHELPSLSLHRVSAVLR